MTLSDPQPLIHHLEELRRRLIYSLLAFGGAFILCFTFADFIFNILARPLASVLSDEPGRKMIFTALQEKFFTNVRVGLFGALFLSFPVIATQVWMFVAPALYKHERRVFLPFLVATPILFLIGACLVYFAVLPFVWRFFAGFEQAGGAGLLPIQMEPKVSEYLSLTMHLMFAFGVVFEMPVLLGLLGRAGLVTAEKLRKSRRWAIVTVFVVAAILTPPDPFSQILLALPMLALYEASIWLVARGEKIKAQSRIDGGAEAA